MLSKKIIYDVAIIGGGASGTSLYYTLAKYTNLKSVALIEKEKDWGQINSRSNNNSQTLHDGSIETNYNLEKATKVKPAANMLPRYVAKINSDRKIFQKTQKMVLAVGEKEVEELIKRHQEFSNLFPDLKLINREEIEKVEPLIVKGRNKNEKIIALYTTEGYAMDYENLAKSFVEEVEKDKKENFDTYLSTRILDIKKTDNFYTLYTSNRENIKAKVIVVNADGYSLSFAKKMGYGKEFSLIPIAGDFYFSKGETLKGKVYTVQDKKLPFAAVHGDPDINHGYQTRWGPTARMNFVIEARNFKTSLDYFKSASLFRWKTFLSFIKILSDWTRFSYLFKNFLYTIPLIGKKLFLKNVQKICPSIKVDDIYKAKGYGGMRLQRVDVKTKELQLGEGKIIGDNIIFNMTPSPGATVCLFNGLRDAENLQKFFGEAYLFEKCKMEKDFAGGCFAHGDMNFNENNIYMS